MDSTSVVNPSSPSSAPPRDTRALLASLEELRDSLSVRVNQLAVAVERLREQAGDLERSIGQQESRRSTRRFNGDLQIPVGRPETQPQPRIDMPSPPITTTSAIASQVSQLNRPITSEEIIRLLDRASASLSSTPDLRLAEMEGTLDGLREVRDSLRAGAVDLARMGTAQDTLRERVRQLRQPSAEMPNRPPARETMHQEAERRLGEINAERAAGQAEKHLRRIRRRKPRDRVKATPVKSGLSPTNANIDVQPAIIRSEGVKPPSARSKVITPASTPTPAPRPSTAHLSPAALDDLHTELAALDLTLEPTEYMHGLSQILRRAMPNASFEDFIATDDTADWDTPESPLSVSSSSTATAHNTPDTGLTFRGIDVERRRAVGEPMTRDDRVRRIRNRVASITGDYSAIADIGQTRAADESFDRGAREAALLERADQMRHIRRARAIIREAPRSNQGVQTIARSARELVQAATQSTDSRPLEHGVTYELTAQTELRAAQASRSRAYSRYQQILSSRSRREARPVPSRVEYRTVSGVIVELQAEVPGADMEEQEARQELVSAQMRESRAQQRLNWARSRLRRDDSSSPSVLSHRPELVNEERDRREQAALWRAVRTDDTAPITVGPRNERPEDVDSLVRIRQLRADGPRTAERIESRRQHLASIRQNLNESRQRISQSGENDTSITSEQDSTIQRLLSDAQQVNDARRSLLDALENDITPSSPITAQGRGEFGHIQISVGTDTATHSDGDEMEVPRAEEDRSEAAAEEDLVLRTLRGNGEEDEHESKETLLAASAPPSSDETAIEAHLWPGVARPKRRERVYISMLDL